LTKNRCEGEFVLTPKISGGNVGPGRKGKSFKKEKKTELVERDPFEKLADGGEEKSPSARKVKGERKIYTRKSKEGTTDRRRTELYLREKKKRPYWGKRRGHGGKGNFRQGKIGSRVHQNLKGREARSCRRKRAISIGRGRETAIRG